MVQPLLVASVVFALPLGARFSGQRIRRVDVGAAVLVVAALVAFLTIAEPSGGRDDAPLGEWLVAGGVCAVVCVPLVLSGASARRRGGRRCSAPRPASSSPSRPR